MSSEPTHRSTPVGRDEILQLIPHQGAMCLLDRVVAFDENSIVAATATHRLALNPLRSGGHLHALHLCEYGAQAMALHGGLLARQVGRAAAPGMLVSLRDVRLYCRYVESLPEELLVRAVRLLAGSSGFQYAFEALHAGTLLVSGRAAVLTPPA